MTTSNSWTVTLEANTEAHHGWDVYAEWLTVEIFGH
jgi:hypothetical protein